MNNREIATLVWLTIFSYWLLRYKPDVRHAIGHLLKTATRGIVGMTLLAMTVYISIATAILYRVGYWTGDMLWSSVTWLICVAIWSLMQASTEQDERFFVTFIMVNLKIAILIGFLRNAYPFPLWGELIAVPVCSLFVVMHTFTEGQEEYSQVHNLFAGLLAIVGYFLMAYIAYSIYSDFSNFSSAKNLRGLALPLVYSALYCPFLYALSVYALTETAAVRLSFRFEDKKAGWSCALLLLRKCKFSRRRLIRFSQEQGRDVWVSLSPEEAKETIRGLSVSTRATRTEPEQLD